MEPRTNLKSIGKTTISIVIVERVEGMGIYGWRLEERFARGWRQRKAGSIKIEVGGQKSEISRLRLTASARQGGRRSDDGEG